MRLKKINIGQRPSVKDFDVCLSGICKGHLLCSLDIDGKRQVKADSGRVPSWQTLFLWLAFRVIFKDNISKCKLSSGICWTAITSRPEFQLDDFNYPPRSLPLTHIWVCHFILAIGKDLPSWPGENLSCLWYNESNELPIEFKGLKKAEVLQMSSANLPKEGLITIC